MILNHTHLIPCNNVMHDREINDRDPLVNSHLQKLYEGENRRYYYILHGIFEKGKNKITSLKINPIKVKPISSN